MAPACSRSSWYHYCGRCKRAFFFLDTRANPSATAHTADESHRPQGRFYLATWWQPKLYKQRQLSLYRTQPGHSKRWLTFSANKTPEGTALRDFVTWSGMEQLVKHPTRGEKLLDLVISDLGEIKASVTCQIADHRGVLADLSINMPKEPVHSRVMWNFRGADWQRMEDKLKEESWEFLESDPNRGAEFLSNKILEAARSCIPRSERKVSNRRHPWLTQRAAIAVSAKHAAVGTEKERDTTEECSNILMDEYQSYVTRTQKEVTTFRGDSKLWWSRARQLVIKKGQVGNISALKVSGQWVHSAKEKAVAFAHVFCEKNRMPLLEINCYTAKVSITNLFETVDPSFKHVRGKALKAWRSSANINSVNPNLRTASRASP